MPRRRTYTTPTNEKAIGARLREFRKRRGMTQAEVATHLGIDQTLVSNYERGAARLHGALLAGFAKALRVSSDEILSLKESKETTPIKDRRFLRRLPDIDRLPKRDKQTLLRTIDGILKTARAS